MPLPKPRPRENRSKFIQRCMSDPNVKRDFTFKGQSFAVCQSLFKKGKK